MKDLLKKIFKVFLVLAVVILAAFLVFALVFRMDWSWWVGIFLLLGLLSLAIAGLFLRKLWLRRREQYFVQQVIEQDEAHLKSLQGKERDDSKELQNRWAEAIEALQKSHLRRLGNPLYVLPWYMVLGESGSGKTTAIQSARLSSPFAEVTRTPGVSGTRNCDWWFFEQAIILDTAGRYAIPVDEGRDKEEWQRFLNLLVKYRKKEPLHGLIVAINADKLLEATPEVLGDEGYQIRRRIDELMRALGAKFPVYVLVTKCDLIQGMTQFCDQLSEKALDQPMGFINQELSGDVAAFLERALGAVGERLRNLRILLLHATEARNVDPGFLLFPEEFENLKGRLQSFMQGMFQANPYQETPLLRGLFFSSGRQEGTPFSHFLKALGVIGEREVLPGTSRGLFLHDFFAKILPQDRGLFAPTRRALEWRSLTRNLGLTSWVILGVALCGLLSFSFVYNLKLLREVSHMAKLPPAKGEILEDLDSMDRFRQSILALEDQKRKLWMRFGLDESEKVEMGLKAKYGSQFRSRFLEPLDRQTGTAFMGLSSSTSGEVIGQYAIYLIRRIQILKARLGGEALQDPAKQLQPSFILLPGKADAALETEVNKKFGALYLYYLLWQKDSGEIAQEMNLTQTRLKQLLALKGSNLQWVAAWVNTQSSLPSLTRKDFWGGSVEAAGERPIPPAFTRKGKDLIDSFISEMESVVADRTAFGRQRGDLEQWYQTACFEAWQNFSTLFPRGTERLNGLPEWQQAAARMATDQNPYFAFLNRLALELEPFARAENIPSWLRQAFLIQVVKAAGVAEGVLKDKGVGGKIVEEGKKILSTVKKPAREEIEDLSRATKSYQEYQAGLAAIAPAASSRNQAYMMASQVFAEDAATSKSPFYTAQGAASRLKGAMKSRPGDEIFWKLMNGPLDFLWLFTRLESACYLQSQWEEKVLAEAQGATGTQAQQILLGPDGLTWKFVRGPAAPFIARSLKGFSSKEAMGGTLPFEASFFNYLARGAQASAVAKKSFAVKISGMPTSANPEAKTKPHATRLELQCSTGPTSLENLNYPVTKTFTWSPETCGDVSLQIDVGDVSLKKKYSGDQGFPEFLQDFRVGQRTFTPADFPDQRGALDRLGIRFIRVHYQFSGQQDVLAQAGAFPRQAPTRIINCWGP
jgi:type VI secretion system protein ImpL